MRHTYTRNGTALLRRSAGGQAHLWSEAVPCLASGRELDAGRVFADGRVGYRGPAGNMKLKLAGSLLCQQGKARV